MNGLSDNLDQALRTIDPGPEPVDDVMRRGKRIRLRRRITAAAGAAAVAAAVLAGYPALTRPHSLAPSTVSGVPAGPGSATPHHLRSPLVLQAMLALQPAPAGGCPAGYATLPGANPGMCYRKTGTPVTITSAAISPITSYQQKPPQGDPAAHTTTMYQIIITLPAADAPALTAVTTTAANTQGALAISVAGKTWALPIVEQPFTGRQLTLPLTSRNQALQLQRILAAAG